ncbi:hypothetical protein [Delftia sp.]|uniref:hypothetical protein n=1 Tax=Delftia sp. TaxID=1886637 RepID=UPI00259CAB21|nr:hypothetical protein [Delftia sp.]
MATSKTNSVPQPATASTRLPSLRPDTSRATNRLSDSEIESLRKDAAEASAKMKEILARQTPTT